MRNDFKLGIALLVIAILYFVPFVYIALAIIWVPVAVLVVLLMYAVFTGSL